ncbi:MAG: YdeI/OmpD-associated family protein, partial [Pirellula sp.]
WPSELVRALEGDSRLREAFEALTPGRQRGYLLYVAGAKQSKTRMDRIEKNRERILNGLGLHD